MSDAPYLRAKAREYLGLAERAGGWEACALRELATQCNSDAEKLEGAASFLNKADPESQAERRGLGNPTHRTQIDIDIKEPSHRQICTNCSRDMRPVFRDGASGDSELAGFECQPCGLTIIGRPP